MPHRAGAHVPALPQAIDVGACGQMTHTPCLPKQTRGFSLIELLIVLTLAALILGFAIPSYPGPFNASSRLLKQCQ
jgi:prepilin-type N-terminal cleavage/methylation domain-containing protein